MARACASCGDGGGSVGEAVVSRMVPGNDALSELGPVGNGGGWVNSGRVGDERATHSPGGGDGGGRGRTALGQPAVPSGRAGQLLLRPGSFQP